MTRPNAARILGPLRAGAQAARSSGSSPARHEASTARESLAKAWLPRVYGLAVALTRNRTDAEDLTQEAFLRAFRTPATLRDPAAFGPWMVRIVRNAWTDRLRRGGRERPLERPDLLEAPAEAPPGGVVGRWARLTEGERLVVWLKVVVEMTFREIAELLALSKSAVDRTFRAAIENLRGAKP